MLLNFEALGPVLPQIQSSNAPANQIPSSERPAPSNSPTPILVRHPHQTSSSSFKEFPKIHFPLKSYILRSKPSSHLLPFSPQISHPYLFLSLLKRAEYDISEAGLSGICSTGGLPKLRHATNARPRIVIGWVRRGRPQPEKGDKRGRCAMCNKVLRRMDRLVTDNHRHVLLG